MSNSSKNVVVRKLKGKFADQVVFKEANGHSVMANVPEQSDRPPSAAQESTRDAFRMASNYAKNALKDPELKALYEATAQNGQSAYSAAMTDFLTPPEIKTLDVSGYKGMEGGVIAVRAFDPYTVKGVQVIITAADGSTLEEGEATPDSNQNYWLYTAQKNADPVAGTIVTAIAKDYPGNTGTLEATL